MVPSIKAAAAMPRISSNPRINVPFLAVWLPMSCWRAAGYVRGTPSFITGGRTGGLVFAGVNIAADARVPVGWLEAGGGHASSGTVGAKYVCRAAAPGSMLNARAGKAAPNLPSPVTCQSRALDRT